ncbi:MAG: glycosyltransferase [Bacteroidetes bacterium]|nr:glycosyltransferase [Bacteroidota bacterium]
MKISIITPSFNQSKYLEETILSVLNQNYPELEYIIIDGGSTDGSIEIIKKYENYFTYWISEKDRGQSEAINKGLEKATGEIITWINSDDKLFEGALFKVADHFLSSPDVGLIYGGVIFDEKKINNNNFGYDNPCLERYLAGIAFPQPAAFFKRSLLEKVGSLNEKYHYGMDYDLFSRLALITQFKKTNDIFSYYRLHPESKSVKDYFMIIEDWIDIFLALSENLQLKKSINTLKNLKVFDNYLKKVDSGGVVFSAHHIQIDENKLLFYFLSYVIRGWYAAGKFKECKIVLNYIQKNYSQSLIAQEEGIPYIEKRLYYFPISILKLWRKVSRGIEKF